MRLLHTSDWHLGRSFHGVGMLDAQATFVDHLVETVEREQVDLVVIAGDVYDRALPPVDAVRVAEDALVRLAASRARVVVSSGNHDSQRRLGFSSRLIDAAGVHLRTSYDRVDEPVVLADDHGAVAVYAVPYLEPDLVRQAWDLPARSHETAMDAALQRVRADLATRPTGTRSVVLAHAFVTGGAPSESERDIAVGGVSSVPLCLFEGITYTALGHLHGRQSLRDDVRYSGSPLAYSFSEADHVKGSWLVDLDAAGVARARFVAAPVPRPLARLHGTLEELLDSPAHAVHEQSWVQATLTDELRPVRAMERLQTRFPHALSVQFRPVGGGPETSPSPTTGRSDHEIALDFLAHVRQTPADDAESALLREAVEACCHDDRDLDHVALARSGGS